MNDYLLLAAEGDRFLHIQSIWVVACLAIGHVRNVADTVERVVQAPMLALERSNKWLHLDQSRSTKSCNSPRATIL